VISGGAFFVTRMAPAMATWRGVRRRTIFEQKSGKRQKQMRARESRERFSKCKMPLSCDTMAVDGDGDGDGLGVDFGSFQKKALLWYGMESPCS
jgi:hypothetical protein